MACPEAPRCYSGVARDSAGFRFMQQMGWKEGEGLGKEKQGIKSYVKVKNKQDTNGVGLKKDNNWLFDTSQFEGILKRLKVQVAGPDDKDILQTADLEDDSQISEQNLVVKATRPQGRYKKRELGKTVGAYSAKDLEGIFGNKQIVDAAETDCGAVDIIPPIEYLDPCQVEAKGHKFDCSLLQRWGHSHGFVSGGFLGEQHRSKKLLRPSGAQCPEIGKRVAFVEEDQENLYKLVQDKATSGKRGLGSKEQKIAGCHWKGRKISFSESGDDECSDSCDSPRQNFNDGVGVKAKNEKKPKLKSLCKKILQEFPSESIKLKQLMLLVEARSASFFSGYCSHQDAISYLKQKLQGSKTFHVEGSRVSLQKIQKAD